MTSKNFIALEISDSLKYPDAPFNPPQKYAEFKPSQIIRDLDKSNEVYSSVRESFHLLGLDNENFGTDSWNPFSEFVKAGDNVVIKPNLVNDKHVLGVEGTSCTITHASIVRTIIDYVLLATDGKCNIVICDVPLQTADWNHLIEKSGMKKLVNYYLDKGVSIQLLDMRKEIAHTKSEIIVERTIHNGDPLGYKAVDLGDKSELMPIIAYYKRLEITDYGKGTVSLYHNPYKNEYCIPKTILNSDVFINVPKMKTHRKAGLTCAMKNLIGINGDKKWIAHHRRGNKNSGGDEYPELKSALWLKWHLWELLKRHHSLYPLALALKKMYLGKKTLKEYSLTNNTEMMEGSWYGNDTLWRCILDINKILFYADKDGLMSQNVQRRYFCVVDGIVSAEGEGPMHGHPKYTGIIMAGFNPVAIDKICADLMGFDYTKIPQIKGGFSSKIWDLTNFDVDDVATNLEKVPNFNFRASGGWIGHVEKSE
ncbi:DUF362 domain-containing protein [Methanolobus sp. ZRKC2]|uniref:DUF362 domain-containing protein n=1 Tax=Methanolobus sp. ZRKC2 TaxID=3125783 RepID=UPI0032498362